MSGRLQQTVATNDKSRSQRQQGTIPVRYSPITLRLLAVTKANGLLSFVTCGKAQKVGGTHRYVGKLKKWVAHTDGTHRCTDDLPPLKKRFEDSNVMLR